MIEAVRSSRVTISYTELASKITVLELEARNPRLNHLLCDVSTEEDAAGRGMLSVVVVHKTGDLQPRSRVF